MTPLTPQAFVESCERARPTHHLFGWGSKDLGEMVAGLLAAIAERDARLAMVAESGMCCGRFERNGDWHDADCPLSGWEPYK